MLWKGYLLFSTFKMGIKECTVILFFGICCIGDLNSHLFMDGKTVRSHTWTCCDREGLWIEYSGPVTPLLGEVVGCNFELSPNGREVNAFFYFMCLFFHLKSMY